MLAIIMCTEEAGGDSFHSIFLVPSCLVMDLLYLRVMTKDVKLKCGANYGVISH